MYKKRIEELLSEMTIDEKLGQLTQECLTESCIDALIEKAERGEIGSCILSATAMAGAEEQEKLKLSRLNAIQKAAVEKSRMKIPVIYGRDIIHGSRTIFPIPLAQMATWDFDIIKDSASIMAEEASKEGVHWTFAPMLDVCCDARWGRIIECPGEDPMLGRVFARASVEGIQGEDMSQKGKMAACAKHYIGYGASAGGRDKDTTEWSEYSLRNRALPAFKEAVDAGVATVMSAFNEISGQPATSSRYYLTDVLKDELSFDGFVISDYDAILRLKEQGVSDSDETSATLAMNAGVDMDMVDCLYRKHLKDAVECGKVSMDTIDEAVRRVLRIKFRLGLFDNPYTDENISDSDFMTESHLEKAKEASLHSMVLLKNNGILPLEKGTAVAVKGPMAEEKEALLGSWHAGGRAEDVISLGEGIARVAGADKTEVFSHLGEDMWYYPGISDVFVIALGESHYITGEGMTKTNIELSAAQIECVRKAKEIGKKVIAVIFAGRPLAIGEIMPYCDAVLWAWHGGTMCGLAAAEIIFGEFNPCGRLPVTIPRSTGQIPTQYNHQRHELGVNWYYEHEEYVARDNFSTPLFVFGYGLSYTDFEYSGFEFEDHGSAIEVEGEIKNTGTCDGWEVVQCYVTDVVASATRPVKELKAFEKVYIKSGETAKVKFVLSKEDLSFYDLRGNWIFEPGEFVIQIGRNSRDICCEFKV